MVALLTAVLGLAGLLVNWMQSRQQIGQASAQIIASQLQGVLDEIKSAQKIRSDVDARTSGPDASAKLRNDEAGFFRDES